MNMSVAGKTLTGQLFGNCKMELRVSFVTLVLAHYRTPFHDLAHDLLASQGVRYELIYSDPIPRLDSTDNSPDLSWAKDRPWVKKVNGYSFQIGPEHLYWQAAIGAVTGSNLTIIGQESRLLFNYWAHLTRSVGSRVAYFGHGRNFQSGTDTFAARFKAFWATRVDWWFGYTEETRRIVMQYGFPPGRITVLNNSIDTSEIRRAINSIDETQAAIMRANMGIGTNKIGVYVGRLYDIKRIDFLIEAALQVRRQVPDFRLIVVGDGSGSEQIQVAAAAHPWIIYLGPRYGREKIEILRLGRVFMMPGAVGLSILDCAAAGIPIVTTAYPFHGPELSYLEPERTGLIVDDWRNPKAYADAVVSVLSDDLLYKKLATGAWHVGNAYTIEKMAQRFSDGVTDAINYLMAK
jgi:glycosyltransferase involved in cell wall biosynthesis